MAIPAAKSWLSHLYHAFPLFPAAPSRDRRSRLSINMFSRSSVRSLLCSDPYTKIRHGHRNGHRATGTGSKFNHVGSFSGVPLFRECARVNRHIQHKRFRDPPQKKTSGPSLKKTRDHNAWNSHEVTLEVLFSFFRPVALSQRAIKRDLRPLSVPYLGFHMSIAFYGGPTEKNKIEKIKMCGKLLNY
jgi:hypothetical protein